MGKIDGYITVFWWVAEMERLENYDNEDFTDAGMTEIREKVEVPSREVCEKLCQNNSGPINIYNLK